MRGHRVAVGVPVHPDHDVGELQQQVSDSGAVDAVGADHVLHRGDGVVAEDRDELISAVALHPVARGVEIALAVRLQLGGEPVDLGLVQ